MSFGAESRVLGRWKLGPKLGAGAFGEVYRAIDVESEEVVSVKLEKADVKDPVLHYEKKIYDCLKSSESERIVGVPRCRYYGQHAEFNILVMDYLGPAVIDRITLRRRRLSLKSVVMIGLQSLRCLELIHDKSIIHRDLKPDNILTGNDAESSTLFIVDYGLAKPYRDIDTHRHIQNRSVKRLIGTRRYASINTHLGLEQSRRDDMKSLGYALVYLAKGELPWHEKTEGSEKEVCQKIRELKQKTSSNDLCKGMPTQFVNYFEYVKSLRFKDRPDYEYLRGLFRKAMDTNGLVNDGVFDWMDQSASGQSGLSVARRMWDKKAW